MDFDEILDHVGGYGRYQKRTILLMTFACVIASSSLFEPVFQSYEPDHWCATPEIDAYNCSDVGDYDAEQCNLYKKYITIPHTITGSNETVFSQCTKYSEILQEYDDNESNDGVIAETDCDAGWDYNTTGLERSIVTDFDLVCGKQILLNIAHVVCFTGVSVGAVIYGILADKIGRLYTFYSAVIPTGIISVLLAFSPNVIFYMILRAFTGITAPGVFTTAILIATEVVDPSKRVRAGFFLYFGYSGGCILLVFVAYFIRNWRFLQLVLSLPVAVTLLYTPFLHRSPRWLLSTGKNREASKVVRKISSDNRNSFPDKLFSESERLKKEYEQSRTEEAKMRHLLRSPILFGRTIVLLHNWFLYNLVYTSFYLYCDDDGNVYMTFALAAIAEVPASLVTMLVVERVGRKKFIMPLTFITGVSCLLIAFLEPPYSFIFVLIGKFAICSAYNTNIIYTSEVYPTRLRGTTGGLCNSFGRFSGTICPMFLLLGERWKPLPLLTLGIWTMLASLLVFLLPETHGKNLPSTIQEAEELGRGPSTPPSDDPAPEHV